MIDTLKNMSSAQKLGNRVQLFRRNNDIKAVHMAAAIDVSKTTFSARELGRSNWTALELIAMCKKYPQLKDFVFSDDY